MYTLDVQAARHADTAGATIKEIGKYVGEFIQAKDVVTKKGGRGIEFIFKTRAGKRPISPSTRPGQMANGATML